MGRSSYWQLSRFLINKDFQLKIIARSLLFMFFAVLFSVSITLIPHVRNAFFQKDLDLELQYNSLITIIELSSYLVPGLILLFISFFIYFIFFTHRFCGPLINFKNTFNKIRKGDLTVRVHLRKGDYLNDESHIFNEMINDLANNMIELKSKSEKLNIATDKMIGNVDELIREDKVINKLEDIKSLALQISDSLLFFNLDSNDTKTSKESDS